MTKYTLITRTKRVLEIVQEADDADVPVWVAVEGKYALGIFRHESDAKQFVASDDAMGMHWQDCLGWLHLPKDAATQDSLASAYP